MLIQVLTKERPMEEVRCENIILVRGTVPFFTKICDSFSNHTQFPFHLLSKLKTCIETYVTTFANIQKSREFSSAMKARNVPHWKLDGRTLLRATKQSLISYVYFDSSHFRSRFSQSVGFVLNSQKSSRSIWKKVNNKKWNDFAIQVLIGPSGKKTYS